MSNVQVHNYHNINNQTITLPSQPIKIGEAAEALNTSLFLLFFLLFLIKLIIIYPPQPTTLNPNKSRIYSNAKSKKKGMIK